MENPEGNMAFTVLLWSSNMAGTFPENLTGDFPMDFLISFPETDDFPGELKQKNLRSQDDSSPSDTKKCRNHGAILL